MLYQRGSDLAGRRHSPAGRADRHRSNDRGLDRRTGRQAQLAGDDRCSRRASGTVVLRAENSVFAVGADYFLFYPLDGGTRRSCTAQTIPSGTIRSRVTTTCASSLPSACRQPCNTSITGCSTALCCNRSRAPEAVRCDLASARFGQASWRQIGFCGGREGPAAACQVIASNTPAAPIPVPMHMVTIPYFCLRRRKPCTTVAVRIAPVAPSG